MREIMCYKCRYGGWNASGKEPQECQRCDDGKFFGYRPKDDEEEEDTDDGL